MELDKQFEYDKNFGRIYEIIVGEKLASSFLTMDVHDKEQYRDYGDFIIKKPGSANKKEYYIDVKADRRMAETGNIFVEVARAANGRDFRKGWIDKHYDYLSIVDTVNQDIYIINFHKLLKEFDWTDEKICFEYKGHTKDNGGKTLIKGYVINFMWLLSNDYVQAVYTFDDEDVYIARIKRDSEIRTEEQHCYVSPF